MLWGHQGRSQVSKRRERFLLSADPHLKDSTTPRLGPGPFFLRSMSLTSFQTFLLYVPHCKNSNSHRSHFWTEYFPLRTYLKVRSWELNKHSIPRSFKSPLFITFPPSETSWGHSVLYLKLHTKVVKAYLSFTSYTNVQNGIGRQGFISYWISVFVLNRNENEYTLDTWVLTFQSSNAVCTLKWLFWYYVTPFDSGI